MLTLLTLLLLYNVLPLSFKLFDIFKKYKNTFRYVHIYRNSLDLKETLKTSLYVTQKAPNSPNDIFGFHIVQKYVFSKIRHSKSSALHADI